MIKKRVLQSIEHYMHGVNKEITVKSRRRKIYCIQRRPECESLEIRTLLNGSLDSTFNGDGQALFQISSAADSFASSNALVIQSDGKIITAGYTGLNLGDTDFAVVRQNTDGLLDTSFGDGGKATVSFDLGGSNNDTANAVTIQSDGKIIIVGTVDRDNFAHAFGIARLNVNGTLDDTFNGTGKVVVPFNIVGIENVDSAHVVEVQADGKIVVAGEVTQPHDQNSTHTSNATDFAIVRLNANGSLDTTFGNSGKIYTDFKDDSYDYLNALVIQKDGRILVGGSSEDTSFTEHMALIRYNSDGTFDTSFGTGGKVVVPIAERIYDLAIRPDGRIIAAGSGNANANVVQLLSDGTIDNSFHISSFQTEGVWYATAVALEPNGKIVLAGGIRSLDNFDYHRILVQLNSDGTPDLTFGSQGALSDTGDLPTYDAYSAVAIQRDGKIVTAGWSNNGFSINRYFSEPPSLLINAPSPPTLDTAFDTGTIGDGQTKNTQPCFVGTAEPGLRVDLLNSDGEVLGWTFANSFGLYSVSPLSTLSVGTYQLTTRASTETGIASPASSPSTITILKSGISPTLIVSAHGQYVDTNAIASLVATMFASAYPLLSGGLLAYDIVNGIPVTGSGRARDPWQDALGPLIYQQMTAAIGDQSVAVKSLEVEWDTYGSVNAPAQEVANKIKSIVSDTSYDGEPWDVLFVGFSRGGPFVNQVIKSLDLVNNPRIDYSEAIYLDPTASVISGDQFPNNMPPGLDHAIQYDDGYSFPLSQLGFTLLDQHFKYSLLTRDGNTGNRVSGGDYRYIRTQMEAYLETLTGNNAYDSRSVHSNVPYWWLNNTPRRSAPGQVVSDVASFLEAKDHGSTGQAGSKLIDLGSEIYQPASSSPNFKDSVNDILVQLKKIGEAILNNAKQFVSLIMNEAKRLAANVADEANKAIKALISNATNEASKVLAEAKLLSAQVAKAAQAEINKIIAEAQRTADKLFKEGKLFTASASKQADLAAKNLVKVEAQSKKLIDAAKNDAAKKITAAKNAAKAVQEAEAKLASAAQKAKAAAEAEAQKLKNSATKAAANVSNKVNSVRKKFHF